MTIDEILIGGLCFVLGLLLGIMIGWRTEAPRNRKKIE